MPNDSSTSPNLRFAICVDTEFTNFEEPELLSLGLCSCTGEEHYAEVDLQAPGGDALVERCHNFVREGDVLAQWGQRPDDSGTYAEMAQRTADWLTAEAQRIRASYGQTAVLAYDHRLDFLLLCRLLTDHGHWTELAPLLQPVDVKEWVFRLPGGMARYAAYERLEEVRGLRQHHALADAIALRAALRAITTNRAFRL